MGFSKYSRIALTVFVSLVIIAGAAFFIAGFEFLVDRSQQNLAWYEPTRVGISLGAALILTVTNRVIYLVVRQLTALEKHDTRTEYEESLYFKLALSFVVNQSLLVLIVASNLDPSTWSIDANDWFLPDGPMDKVFLVVLINAAEAEFARLLRPLTLYRRYIIGPFAKSEERVAERWEPEVRPARRPWSDGPYR